MTLHNISERAPGLSRELLLDCDAGETIVAVNAAWKPVLGWSEAELLNRKIFDFVHPDDRVAASQRWTDAARTKLACAFECRIQHKDGSFRPMSWKTMAVVDHVYASIVAICGEDSTDSLEKSETALYQLHRLATISQLTGGISHDFNNLLQNIVASLELVRRLVNSGRGPETEKFIASAIAAAQRAAALNQDLRSFTQANVPDTSPVDINALIAGMSTMLGRSLPNAIKLDLQLSPDLWKVRCDQSEAQTALLNLVLNACEAMPDGGTITIQTNNLEAETNTLGATPGDLSAQLVCLTISDTGHGLIEEVKQYAFEPFFTTKADGMGLGLAAVARFVTRIGGKVDMISEKGRGATVRVYLPGDFDTDGADS